MLPRQQFHSQDNPLGAETQNLLISKWKELEYISHCFMQQSLSSSGGSGRHSSTEGEDSTWSKQPQTQPRDGGAPLDSQGCTGREGAFNPSLPAPCWAGFGVGRMRSLGLTRSAQLRSSGKGLGRGASPYSQLQTHPASRAAGAAFTPSSPRSHLPFL